MPSVTGLRRSRRLLFCLLVLLVAVSLKPTAGQTSRREVIPLRPSRFNKLANSQFVSAATTESLPIPQWFSIASVSNEAPVVVTTTIPHSFTTGAAVVIKGVQGTTAANGYWVITALDARSFSLQGSSGNAAYAGGGAIFPTAGQPRPPGSRDSEGEYAWSPWFSVPASIEPSEFFVSDGARATGEVTVKPPTVPADALVTQEIDGSQFRPGEHLTLSIEARMPEATSGNEYLRMRVTLTYGKLTTYEARVPASAMTTEYQRFTMRFALPADPVASGDALRVEFRGEAFSGPLEPMLLRRPMLNAGDDPAPWTPEVEPSPLLHDFYPTPTGAALFGSASPSVAAPPLVSRW